MNVAELSIKHRTTMFVLVAVILLGGVMCYEKMGRLEDPEFTVKEAKVYTYYPGATAMEVAEEVTDPIETSIQEMGQIWWVKSISEPGKSTVHVKMLDKYDKTSLPQVWDELRRKVNDVQKDLPPGTSQSTVFDDFGDVFGVFLALHGDGYSYSDLLEMAKLLRRELLLCDDVAKVALFAPQQEVVYAEISRAKLSAMGLSPQTVFATLSRQNLVAEAGDVRVGDLYVRINPSGEFQTVEEIGELLILQKGGTKIRLSDLAKIYRGYADPPTTIMRFNGRPAIGIGISTREGGNVMTMGASLDKRLHELIQEIPIGIEVDIISHQAQAVDVAISGFVISLLEAIAIVIAVLMIAMGLRSGILIGVILLLTVLGTFIPMYVQGVMLERISLGALIIALGMLVDNAIVVVEGILINQQKGMTPIEAAKAIVKQTMWPLFGATIVAVLAFSAIGASQDATGEYCRSLFMVIMYSLTLSWLLAITVTPLFGVMVLKIKALKEGEERKDPYGGLFFVLYRRLLELCIRRRWVTVMALVAMLAVSLHGFGFVSRSFFPDSTSPQFMVHYWLPQGTHLERTDADLRKIAKRLQEKFDAVTDTTAIAGQGAMRFILTYAPEDANDAYGLLLVRVDDPKAISELIPKVEALIKEEFPDAQGFCQKFILGPGEAYKIQARFRGPDPDVLRLYAAEAQLRLRNSPDIANVSTDWRERVPMVRPIVGETQARQAGITRAAICEAIATTFGGQTIGQYREGDELLPIIARAPAEERKNANSLEDVQIWSPMAQKSIPLSQVVLGLETVSEDTLVRRRHRLPTITVRGLPPEGMVASESLEKIRPLLESIKLAPGYTLEYGGEYEDSGNAQNALKSKIPMVILGMFLIVVVLFDSLREPIVIFLTVPLAIIGVTVGLLIMDQPFGFMALLGFMSLSGMLIKNAIVLIDEIRVQRTEGASPYDALINAGVSRLRPVSMAAMTTVLGMIPLLADAFFVAMAVTIMFGLTFATVLTMVVVPVLYACFFRVKSPPKT